MNTPPSKALIDEHLPDAIKDRLNAPPKDSVSSDAVLGGIDGCVTTFSVVSGVIGAGLSPSVALVMGFANLMADGFSMAISNYESIKTRGEFVQSLREAEAEHIDRIPEGEQEELRQIFANKGFSGDILEKIVGTIASDRRLWIETMLTEEHGVQTINRNPVKAAMTTFCSFVLFGAIPLLPFVVLNVEPQTQFALSSSLAALMFFVIGAMKSRVLSRPILRSGLSTLVTGSMAATLAFLVGYLLREVFGIAAA